MFDWTSSSPHLSGCRHQSWLHCFLTWWGPGPTFPSLSVSSVVAGWFCDWLAVPVMDTENDMKRGIITLVLAPVWGINLNSPLPPVQAVAIKPLVTFHLPTSPQPDALKKKIQKTEEFWNKHSTKILLITKYISDTVLDTGNKLVSRKRYGPCCQGKWPLFLVGNGHYSNN